MKNSTENGSASAAVARIATHASLLAAVSFGFCATWFGGPGQQQLSQWAGVDLAGEFTVSSPWQTGRGEQSEAGAEQNPGTTSNYVQEPLARATFKPDFSSGLRRTNQRSNYAMLRAFSDVVGAARLSTVRLVNAAGDRVALGAVVDSEGWIATKASQLPGHGGLAAQLADNSEVAAEIVQQFPEMDIALLRVQRSGLVPVPWASRYTPTRGNWLATTDVDKMPSAVGVVSAGIQHVRPTRPVLGVELHDSSAGAAVMRVLYGTGADLAGLKQGDIITAVNGTQVASHGAFQRAIGPSRGGEVVKLTVSRGEKIFESEARLMDLAEELLDETEMEVNGPVSARATGFERVFLHDTVLEPSQCGGPVCNLDGEVVGLNIARAGRVTSYALPVEVVRPMIEGMIAQAKLVSRSAVEPVAGQVR